MIQKSSIPRFESEAQEAHWWDEHREGTAEWMEEAATTGQTTTLFDVLKRARQRAGSTVSIPIDPDDIARARSLAAKRGLDYPTFLTLLLHEALQREERTG